MARWDKTWSSTVLQSRDNKVRWHAETNLVHAYRFFYQKTIKSFGTLRQNMVIRTLYAIQRQSNPPLHGDKTWSSRNSLPSRHNQVWWRMETNIVIHNHFCYLETIKSDSTLRQNIVIRLFAIQRQSSPMARRDKTWRSTPFSLSTDNQVWWHTKKTWSSAPSLPSRDNQVWWHAETKHGHPPFCKPETIKFDGTWRQNMVIRTLFAIKRQSNPTVRADKTWSSTLFLLSSDNQVRWHAYTKNGHPHHFFYPMTIQCDGTWRQTWSSTHFLLSRENQVWWHPETNHGHPYPFCYPEKIMSDGT